MRWVCSSKRLIKFREPATSEIEGLAVLKEEEHSNILALRLASGLRVFMLTCIITHTCDIYNICVIYNFIMQYLIHLKEYINLKYMGFLMAQMVKNLPAMWETWVRSLGWENPLEKGMATHSSILARQIPWTEEPGGPQSTVLKRVGDDWATNTHKIYIVFYKKKINQTESPSGLEDNCVPKTTFRGKPGGCTVSMSHFPIRLFSFDSCCLHQARPQDCHSCSQLFRDTRIKQASLPSSPQSTARQGNILQKLSYKVMVNGNDKTTAGQATTWCSKPSPTQSALRVTTPSLRPSFSGSHPSFSLATLPGVVQVHASRPLSLLCPLPRMPSPFPTSPHLIHPSPLHAGSPFQGRLQVTSTG